MRPAKTYHHSDLWRQIKILVTENPLSQNAIEEQLCIFSPVGKTRIRSIVRSMADQGEIETWDGLYAYLGDLGGTPIAIYP